MVDNKPIGVALNRNLGIPTAQGEVVEAGLNRLIERRSRQKDFDDEHELWKASVRRYNARRREEMKAAWAAFHESQAASLRQTLEDLVSHHETQAERYRDQPKGAANA